MRKLALSLVFLACVITGAYIAWENYKDSLALILMFSSLVPAGVFGDALKTYTNTTIPANLSEETDEGTNGQSYA